MSKRARQIAQKAALELQQSGISGEGDLAALAELLNCAVAFTAGAVTMAQPGADIVQMGMAMLGRLAEATYCLNRLMYFIAQNGVEPVFQAANNTDVFVLAAARRNLDAFAAVMQAHGMPDIEPYGFAELPPRVLPELTPVLAAIRESVRRLGVSSRNLTAEDIARGQRRYQALTVIRAAVIAACPGDG